MQIQVNMHKSAKGEERESAKRDEEVQLYSMNM